MKELTIDGKKYVKATEIAKHLGYTSDYVGQLCRSEKVDAVQVGRSWYVQADTIDTHKKSRHRSNQAKSKAAIAHYKAAENRRAVTAPKVTHIAVHHYESDDTDLLPPVQKQVVSTEPTRQPKPTTEPATQVTVRSEVPTKQKYKPADKPKIRFSGALSVEQVESNVNKTDSPSTATKGLKVAKPLAATANVSPAATQRVRPAKNAVAVQSDDVHAYVPIHATSDTTAASRGWGSMLRGLVLSALVALVVVGITLTLELSWQYEAGSSSTGYQFSLENIPNIRLKI